MNDSRRTHLIEVVVKVEKYLTLRTDTASTAFAALIVQTCQAPDTCFPVPISTL